jgi:hypothetical protein
MTSISSFGSYDYNSNWIFWGQNNHFTAAAVCRGYICGGDGAQVRGASRKFHDFHSINLGAGRDVNKLCVAMNLTPMTRGYRRVIAGGRSSARFHPTIRGDLRVFCEQSRHFECTSRCVSLVMRNSYSYIDSNVEYKLIPLA